MGSKLGAPAVLIWLVLCVGVSTALVYTVQGAFNVDESIHANIMLCIGACAVLQALLFAEVFRPAWKIPARIFYFVVSVAICAIAVALSSHGDPIADVPENYLIVAVVLVVVNALVFTFSHRHDTCVMLFGVGAFVCGFVQFLYVTNMLVATTVFTLLSLVLISFRSYLDSAACVPDIGFPLLRSALSVGILVPLSVVAVAAVVTLGVIMPLDPPHATIKLFTQELAYEEEYVKSAVSLSENADNVVTSSNVDESLEPRYTTDLKTDESLAQGERRGELSPKNSKDYLSGEFSDVDISSMSQGVQALALNPSIPWPLIILGIIVVLLLLLTVPRYVAHRVWFGRITACDPVDQPAAFYEFFLGRFAKLGIGTPRTLSPVEYANGFRERLYPFVGAQEAGSFDHLVALLVASEYGNAAISDEDLQAMGHLYRRFYYNCRKQLGLFKYLFRYITL